MGYIKSELFKRNNELKTADETWEVRKTIWYYEVKNLLPNLYFSIPNRFKEVVLADGGRIRY